MRFGRAFGKDRKNGKILVTIRRAQTRAVLLHERLARPNPTQQSQGAQVTRSALSSVRVFNFAGVGWVGEAKFPLSAERYLAASVGGCLPRPP